MTEIRLLKRTASAVMCRVCRQHMQPAATSMSHIRCQRGYNALHKQSQAYTSIVLQPALRKQDLYPPPQPAFPSFSEQMHIVMGQRPKQDECQQEC